jgi:hypothetical protein
MMSTQKEVADFLIHYPGVGILISQKTQHDPFSRDTVKNASWVLKLRRPAKRLPNFEGHFASLKGPCGANIPGEEE